MATFGERFKKQRLSRKLTQEQLLELFNRRYGHNFYKSAVSQYENNKRIPAIRVLKDWAEFFNVTTDYLLGLTDENFPPYRPITLKQVIDRAIRDKAEQKQYHEIIKIAESLYPIDRPFTDFNLLPIKDVNEFIKQTQLNKYGFHTKGDLDNVFETIFFEDHPDLRPEVVQKRYDLSQVEHLTGDKLSDWVQLIKKANQFNILPQELMPVLEIIHLSRKETGDSGSRSP